MPKPDHRSQMARAWLHFHAARKGRGSGSAAPRVDWPVYPRRAEHNTITGGGNRRWAEADQRTPVSPGQRMALRRLTTVKPTHVTFARSVRLRRDGHRPTRALVVEDNPSLEQAGSCPSSVVWGGESGRHNCSQRGGGKNTFHLQGQIGLLGQCPESNQFQCANCELLRRQPQRNARVGFIGLPFPVSDSRRGIGDGDLITPRPRLIGTTLSAISPRARACSSDR